MIQERVDGAGRWHGEAPGPKELEGVGPLQVGIAAVAVAVAAADAIVTVVIITIAVVMAAVVVVLGSGFWLPKVLL